MLAAAQNIHTRESAAWLQPAIKNLMQDAGKELQQLKAISVSAGPGSYTGLRVGMASAKGLCYALNIPLITINTLQAMASQALTQINDGTNALLCPMIDARRMEVFTGIYDRELKEVMQPTNIIVEQNSFDEWLAAAPVYFFGNGSNKVKHLLINGNAQFIDVHVSAESLVQLAFQEFEKNNFAQLAYAEPMYVKAFYSTQS